MILQSQVSEGDPKENYVPEVSLVDMFLKARELERKGLDIIHFDVGEPDFEPPKEVVEATVKALRDGKARYTESAGIALAKKAIADNLNEKYNAGISPDQVLLAAGGRLALYYAFMSIPKDAKVGIITPDWPAYRDLSRFLSLKTHFFISTLNSGWSINLEELKGADCKALILNYPNNPTGKVLDETTFEQLLEIAKEKGILVISDEVYSDYIFDKAKSFKSVLKFPDLNYIFMTSLSKSYAMTGFRAAYLVSDKKTVSHLTKLNSMIMTSMPEFVQYSMIAAMSCKSYIRDKVEMIAKRRDVAARALKKYLDADFYLPDGSMYIFPKLHSSKGAFDSERFAVDLLEKQHVSVTPGTSFGGWFKEHIRMTLLQSEARIEEGIERMSKLV